MGTPTTRKPNSVALGRMDSERTNLIGQKDTSLVYVPNPSTSQMASKSQSVSLKVPNCHYNRHVDITEGLREEGKFTLENLLG